MSTKSYQPDYMSRLEAQKHRLESKAEESKMRIQNNLDYVRTDGAEVVKGEALRALAGKNPRAAKIAASVLGIKAPRKHSSIQLSRSRHTASDARSTAGRTSQSSLSFIDKIRNASTSDLMEEVILPTGLALGSSLLFAGTLRGVGTGIKGLTKGLFGGLKRMIFRR